MLFSRTLGFQVSEFVPHRIKPGDCFVIPLPDGTSGYIQYLTWNEELGTLIKVLDYVSPVPLSSTEDLRDVGERFPPVFAGLAASVKNGRWKFIGRLPLNFRFPSFRSTNGSQPGTYHDWGLWDGRNTRVIGDLPADLRSLELKQVWGDELLEERIASGRNPVVELN